MKIGFSGLGLREGKVKFNDPVFTGLAEKFKPAKLTPYYFEFLPDEFESAEAIAILKESVLDLLVHDLEKAEIRMERSEDEAEKKLLVKCTELLEQEIPLSHAEFDLFEHAKIKALGFFSAKPVALIEQETVDSDAVCREILKRSGMMFFYTAGKEEVHAWLVENGANAVTCAGRIHTDLARGFIKADLVSYENMIESHSMQDARNRGVAKLIDRDFVVPEESVLEIRFKV